MSHVRFIDTNRPLQPHHGGIAAWHRSGSDAHLERCFPGQWQEQHDLAYWMHGIVAGIADYAYCAQDIRISTVNRTTPAYANAMDTYLEAPDDVDRWRAFVVPNTTTKEQLAAVQATFARMWRVQTQPLAEHIEQLASDQCNRASVPLVVQQALGALPTLHTVGFETDGPIGDVLAIEGVWIPHTD